MDGDVPEFEIESIDGYFKEYFCNNCKNKFRGCGKNMLCPSCKSSNIKVITG